MIPSKPPSWTVVKEDGLTHITFRAWVGAAIVGHNRRHIKAVKVAIAAEIKRKLEATNGR